MFHVKLHMTAGIFRNEFFPFKLGHNRSSVDDLYGGKGFESNVRIIKGESGGGNVDSVVDGFSS